MRAPVRYAPVDDSYVAYQVSGEGEHDVVLHWGWYSRLDSLIENPGMGDFLQRLYSFARVISFDRRGHGMSDPIDLDNITLEQWMEDVGAVMDAAGSKRAVIIGPNEAGPMAILFAATYPERTVGLVLINTWASPRRRSDTPWGLPDEAVTRAVEGMFRAFIGTEDDDTLAFFGRAAPTFERNREAGLSALRYYRNATSPSMVRRFMQNELDTDVRHVLPLVRVPTLVLHRTGDPWARVEHGRYLSEHIPDARYVEFAGEDHFPFLGETDPILDEIGEFVTGVRPVHEPDRVLSTVLFTDICSSTEQVVSVGDRRWSELLETHDAVVTRELDRHRGKKVTRIGRGDGVLATFDGPARGVRCAQAIIDAVRGMGLEGRAGLHTGEIELRDDDIAGIAVHIADRVAGQAGPGEVLVSRTVVDLVAGSGISFTDRGVHSLKGVPTDWQLYAVER